MLPPIGRSLLEVGSADGPGRLTLLRALPSQRPARPSTVLSQPVIMKGESAVVSTVYVSHVTDPGVFPAIVTRLGFPSDISQLS